MATTISFLRKKSKAKTSSDDDMQLSLDEAKFEMEFLKGERLYLCRLSTITWGRYVG